MTNRYVIDGLLEDLVSRNKDIIVVGPTLDLVECNIFRLLLNELQGNVGRWGYRIARITRSSGNCRIETRAGKTLTVLTAGSPVRLEGSRADIWVVYRLRDWSRTHDQLRIIARNARYNNAEIIEIN